MNHRLNLLQLKKTHASLITRGLDKINSCLTRLVRLSSSIGLLFYAVSVVSRAPNSDTHLYNVLISLFLNSSTTSQDSRHTRLILTLYNHIHLAGLRPDSYSLSFVLKAVVKLSVTSTYGRRFHAQSIRMGLESRSHVATALIHMYSFSSAYLQDGRFLFDNLPEGQRNSAIWNVLILSYAKSSCADEARFLFDKMPHRDAVSWTNVINGYVLTGRPLEAISMFHDMQMDDTVKIDRVAVLAAISACAKQGSSRLGRWIHGHLHLQGFHLSITIGNALIDMYAKCGGVETALRVFESIESKTIVSWTSMIAGYAIHGLADEALALFNRLLGEGVKPNRVTFIALLSACSRAGMVKIGREIFNAMKTRFGMEPTIEHYGCMVDLLGRAGKLEEAEDLLRRMPLEANAAIWGSLLAASKLFKDSKRGEIALNHLMKLEPHNSGNYALLSNTYASLGMWRDSRMVRMSMRDSGLKKIPGGSSIEVNNKLHVFQSTDCSHLDTTTISLVLCFLNSQSKHLYEANPMDLIGPIELIL